MSAKKSLRETFNLDDLNEDRIPDGWDGGQVWHTGGNIWVREFTNEERLLRIGFGISKTGFNPSLWRIEETGMEAPEYEYVEELDSYTCDSDAEALERVYEMMEQAEDGEFE